MNFENTAQAAFYFAINALKSMNAKFNISLPDGTIYTLDGGGNVVKRKAMQRIAYKKIYINRLKTLESGLDMTFDVPDGVDIEGMRGSMSSSCSDLWGSGKFSTKVVNGKIIVWRFKDEPINDLTAIA